MHTLSSSGNISMTFILQVGLNSSSLKIINDVKFQGTKRPTHQSVIVSYSLLKTVLHDIQVVPYTLTIALLRRKLFSYLRRDGPPYYCPTFRGGIQRVCLQLDIFFQGGT